MNAKQDDTVKVVGMDMGDEKHCLCLLNAEGNVVKSEELENTEERVRDYFKKLRSCVVVLEAGTHSRWCAKIIESSGHEVLVGNPRKLRLIWKSENKNDWHDAEMLARVGRLDRTLLHPVTPRGAGGVQDLAVVKARDKLVKTRALLVCHARGMVKTCGSRITKVSTRSFCEKAMEQIPAELQPALTPLNEAIKSITRQIGHYDKLIGKLCKKYPDTLRLMSINGVGPITSLAFVLTLESPSRCKTSREAGAYLGLVPRRDQSGKSDKQMRITKTGNSYLRRLLVGSAQYVLGPFGKDCELRRHGLKLAERGGKNAKRRAVVATARKLATIMHAVWKAQGEYDPSHVRNRRSAATGSQNDKNAPKPP